MTIGFVVDREPDFYAYVIISAYGKGTYDSGGTWPGHDSVLVVSKEMLPKFTKTEEFDEDNQTTKWVAKLNKEEWDQFKYGWGIDLEECNQTMGMLTEYGHMWALSQDFDGMEWNLGGMTEVSMVNVYFCCQDEDAMKMIEEGE